MPTFIVTPSPPLTSSIAFMQAREFQICEGDTTLVALSGFITDYLRRDGAVGKNISVCENFYWDLNDRARTWYGRTEDNISRMFPAAPIPVRAILLNLDTPFSMGRNRPLRWLARLVFRALLCEPIL